MNKRSIGSEYEQRACEYLKDEGYNIVECNYFTQFGEIDIIATKDRILVFVEVKYRSSEKFGYGIEALTKNKQKHLISAAQIFKTKNFKYNNYLCRFDAICFDRTGNNLELTHYKNIIN